MEGGWSLPYKNKTKMAVTTKDIDPHGALGLFVITNLGFARTAGSWIAETGHAR
jgi:hypothetical protein